jgi:hypothetical protein
MHETEDKNTPCHAGPKPRAWFNTRNVAGVVEVFSRDGVFGGWRVHLNSGMVEHVPAACELNVSESVPSRLTSDAPEELSWAPR